MTKSAYAPSASQHGAARGDCRKSKQEAIERLEDSALEIFSEHGFEGASLRDIANHAGVPLSTIDRYFGTKLELFNELKSSIWKQVNREREALMHDPIETDQDGKPTLYAILYAFVYPIASRGISEKRSTLTLRLLREYVAMSVHAGQTNAPETFARVAERWIDAIMEVQPQLSREQVVWLFSFVVMVTFNEQMQHGWYSELLSERSSMSANELTSMIVKFCVAGIQAIAEE